MEDIGRFSDLMQDRKRPIKPHILAILMDGAVRGIACRSFIVEVWKDSIIARNVIFSASFQPERR